MIIPVDGPLANIPTGTTMVSNLTGYSFYLIPVQLSLLNIIRKLTI